MNVRVSIPVIRIHTCKAAAKRAKTVSAHPDPLEIANISAKPKISNLKPLAHGYKRPYPAT